MTTDALEELDRVDDGGPVHLREHDRCPRADDVVAAMCEDAERIKRGEVEYALDRFDWGGDLGDDRGDVVREMADGIVHNLLAGPVRSISDADDGSTLETAVQLFDLDVEVAIDDTRDDGPGPTGGSQR